MQHDHLAFFSHGSAAAASVPSFRMGGAGVVPMLVDSTGGGAHGQSSHISQQKNRSAVEKHIEIVEYLKRLPEKSWVCLQCRNDVLYYNYIASNVSSPLYCTSGYVHRYTTG